MHFPGVKALVEVRETGEPEMVLSIRAMPPISSDVEASDSEGGGVGRPVGVVVSLSLSEASLTDVVLISAGRTSKCDPRTRICTRGA